MYDIDGLNIRVPRGDTADLLFKLTNEDTGQPFALGANQALRLDVFYKSNSQYVLQKSAGASAQEEDGTVTIRLESNDTDKERSSYRYMLRITDSDTGDVDTILGIDENVSFEIR